MSVHKWGSTRGLGGESAAAALIAAALVIGWARTDGRGENLHRELPKNDAWVQYQWDWNRLDSGQKMSATVTLSIVGSVVENDEPCRWVELKYVIPEGSEKGTLIEKLLIREKDLLASANPMEHVLRTWVRFNDEPVYLKEAYNNKDEAIGPLLLWTPGVLKNVAKGGDPKDIEYQHGRLKAAQPWAGRMVLPETNKDGVVVLHLSRKYTLWRHADLAFGFAEAEIKDDVYNLDKTKVLSQQVSVYVLQDAGVGAKTALPDSN
jgi:hypothetical protein